MSCPKSLGPCCLVCALVMLKALLVHCHPASCQIEQYGDPCLRLWHLGRQGACMESYSTLSLAPPEHCSGSRPLHKHVSC